MSDSQHPPTENAECTLDIAEPFTREREARTPPMLGAGGTLRIQFGEPAGCPFPHELLTRRFGFDGIPLSPDEIARCVSARPHLSAPLVERVTVACAPVPVVVPGGDRPAYRIRGLGHVDLLVEGHRVHIEAIEQELGGPGGTNGEVRVYVDDVLEGRSIRLGRLGGSVNSFPAVAAVGPTFVLTVEPVLWTTFARLIVELRERPVDPDRNAPGKSRRSIQVVHACWHIRLMAWLAPKLRVAGTSHDS